MATAKVVVEELTVYLIPMILVSVKTRLQNLVAFLRAIDVPNFVVVVNFEVAVNVVNFDVVVNAMDQCDQIAILLLFILWPFTTIWPVA